MDSLWVTNYENEIDRCKKLYDNFNEGADYIKAVFDELNKYYEKHGDQITRLQLAFKTPSDSTSADMMRQDQSLRFCPDFDSALFLALFKLVSSKSINNNQALKEILTGVTEKMESFLADEGDKISLEKLKMFRVALIKETAIENDMATFLFSIVLSSIFRQQFESYSKRLRTDLYEGGDCPLCGEKPHFGILRPEDGAKEMECWLCGTHWVHSRVKCPYCSNEEREELGYFTIEGNDFCRINYCQSCRRYYKIVDARNFNTDGSMVLIIHNLASLGYDILACREGFSPGSGLEWVNENELLNRQD